MDKFKVEGFPSSVVVDAQGEEHGRIVGARMKPEAYIEEITPFVEKAKTEPEKKDAEKKEE